MDTEKIKAILKNQLVLNDYIMELSEKDLSDLIKAEQAGKKREGLFERIYGRFSKVRTLREKGEMRLGLFKI